MQCPSCQTAVDASQRFCPACGTVLAQSQAGQGGEAREAPTVDPMIGLVLGGKYTVIRLIGEGGMGAVYEGEQQLGTSKRKVAVKTLHPHLSRDAKIKARFEREVGTVAQLEHPNTIQVYDFGTTPEGILYIVMEFLHGKSLADQLEKFGAMPPERAENILQQVCGSLEEAHARGIVHRDLKPDNVVLVERAGKKDFVKVLDFGIAKRSKEEDKDEQKLTQQGMVLGTPPYMSPEQFTGRPIDSRSDIYSLAVMAYEMLSGKLPFKADTAWEWATQHMTQPPIPIESLPEASRTTGAMRFALRKALAKSPDERFQTVKEFIDAFSGVGLGARASSAGFNALARTELGTPVDAGGAYGAPPMGAMPGMPLRGYTPVSGNLAVPGAPVQGYTPVGGNVAFPTPAGIPQPPPREVHGGGNRKMLLGLAGVIGVASIVAIAFAMKGSSGGSKAVDFDNGASGPAPATSLAPASAGEPGATASAGLVDSASGAGAEVPPLNGNGAPHPQAHGLSGAPGQAPATGPAATKEAPAKEVPPAKEPPHPTAPPLPTIAPTYAPTYTPPPATAAPPPAKYDGPDCQRARTLRALGHPREAQSWILSCLSKGGNP
jgi:tRNA A-37 threonylcarbamoyl transferase component Bud32